MIDRLCVYTVITGGYDNLVAPDICLGVCDYVCFCDQDIMTDFWTVVKINTDGLDPVRASRRIKIMTHLYLKDYKHSLFIDGNFSIIGDIEEYISIYSRFSSLMFMRHPQRECIYDEAEACVKLKKDDPALIMKQMIVYAFEGYPRNNGLIASGVIYRKHHDPSLIKLMEEWWSMVVQSSRRDQLSFNYLAWKHSFCYDVADLNYFKNPYFERRKHNQCIS